MSSALERLRRARTNNNAGTSRTGSSGTAIERLRAARGVTKSVVNSQPAYERNSFTNKTGKEALDERIKDFYQKKREEDKKERAIREYKENYGYAQKYAGKSKNDIDKARNSVVLNQHEKDWLNEHQYDYWDSDTLKKAVNKMELESELKTLNNDIKGMEARGYDTPSNYPDKISSIEKELENYADVDTSGLTLDQAKSLLTDRKYSEEYNKWDDDTKALFDSYGEAKRELSIHHNPDKDTLTQEEFDNYLNTTKDFESKLSELGYSDKEIKALSDRAIAQYDEKETARRLQHNLGIADKDAWHKVTVSADSVKKNVFGAIPSAVDLAMQRLLGGEDPFTGEVKEINWNNPYQRDMILSQGAREHIPDDMSGVGRFFYNTGLSMADFISSAALTGGSNLSSAILASSAGTQTAHAVKNRGGSDDQALGAGAVAAVAEMLFETLSLGNLKALQTVSADAMKEGTRLVLKDYTKNAAKQAFAEGTEELWTTLANTFADGLIMGDKSEINVAIQQYLANGMSEEDATRRAWLDWGKNLALDFIGGGLSGGILGGAMGGYNYVAGNYYAKQNYSDNAADIVATGLESPEGTDSYNLAKKYQQRLDSGKKLSGNQLSKIVDANTRQTIAENRDSIKATVQQRLSDLGETGDVDVLAEAISKSVVNDYILRNNDSSALVEDLTRAEKQAINNSANAKKILNEMFLDELVPKQVFNNTGEEISAGNINGQLYALAGEMAAEQLVDAENKTTDVQPIKNTGESKNLLNGQNNVPDGKTILKDTDEEVSVRKILDVNNDSVTVELADGRTVDTKELVFGNPDEGHFYEVVAEMGLSNQDAGFFLSNYNSDNGPSLSEYMNGVMEAYHYGFYGLNKGEISPVSYANMLESNILDYAYTLGIRAGNDAVVKKQAVINKENTVKSAAENVKTLPKGSGNIQNKKSSGSVHFVGKAKQAVKGELIGSSMKVIRALQKYIGNDFYIYESFQKEDGKRYWRNPDTKELEIAPNGFFKSSDGSIWLDIHAGSKGQGLILYTAGHEVTHFIKEFSATKFKALADFLFERVYEGGKTTATELITERLEKIKADEKYSKLSEKEAYELAYEEVVCEACEAVFKDGNLAGMLRQMQAQDVTLYEKFVEAVKNFIAKMKSILSGYEVESKAGRLLESMHDDLVKFEVMWLDALRDASENYRAGTTTSGTESVKHSMAGRNSTNYDWSLLYNAQTMVGNGVDSETVRRETGWFMGYDGKWRYEIDDSSFEIIPKDITSGTVYLSDVVKHDKLFAAYPQLKSITIEAGSDMPDSANASYTPDDRIITINAKHLVDSKAIAELDELCKTEEYKEYINKVKNGKIGVDNFNEYKEQFMSTEVGKRYNELVTNQKRTDIPNNDSVRSSLIHEIQHAIQEIEEFASGSNISYWKGRKGLIPNSLWNEMEEAQDRVTQITTNIALQYGFDVEDMAYDYVRLSREVILDFSQDKLDELNAIRKKAKEGGYLSLFSEFYKAAGKVSAVDRKIQDFDKRKPGDLYLSTAGEVEARDVAKRLDYDENQRKETRPDIDRKDVVFTEEFDVARAWGTIKYDSREDNFYELFEEGEKVNLGKNKDPLKLTEEETKQLLLNAKFGLFDDDTYIPVRICTPGVMRNAIYKYTDGKVAIPNLPMAMKVEKVRQSMEEESTDAYENHKPHGIDEEVLVEIIKKMDNPDYIVWQEWNKRYVEIVSYRDRSGKTALVSIDFGELNQGTYKYAQYMNGFEGGYYNIVVTVFNPDDLKGYLKRADNRIIYEKGSSQIGSGGQSPSHLNEKPFYEDTIAQPDSDVKKFSLRTNVEETKNLVALHNLTANELMKSLDLGGLPMPSIAIIKAKSGHAEYGDVSLVFRKDTIDPQSNIKNRVYGGDAWTPTYPKIEYKVNEVKADKIRKIYYDIAKKLGYDEARPLYNYAHDMEEQLNRNNGESGVIESLQDNTNMMQLYLLNSGKEKVANVEKETVTELSESDVELYDYLIKSLGEDVIREIKAPAGSPQMKYTRMWHEKYEENLKEVYRQMLIEEFKFTDEEADNALNNLRRLDYSLMVRGAYDYLVRGARTVKTEVDYAATTQKIIDTVDADAYKQWLNDIFVGIEEKSGIRNNADPFTRSGNRKSWEALHWENNLENVVRVMSEEDNGTGLFGGVGIWGVSAKEYGSIAEIKDDSDRLTNLDQEQYEQVKEALGERFSEIATSIMNKSADNYFIALDNAMECIVDAVRNSKTKSGIMNNLKQYRQLTVTETAVNDIVDLVKDIQKMPTEYFEAKPLRAVGFDEVATAIIPDDVSNELKNRLSDMGIKYLEYESGNSDSRLEKLNSLEEVKFSDRAEVSPEQREVESIIARENADLKRANDYLNEMLKLQKDITKGLEIPKVSVSASAKRLRNYANVRIRNNVSEFDNLLSEYYEYVSNNINASLEERLNAARPCASWLMDHMHEKKELDPRAKDVLDTLKSTKVYLDEKQMQEVIKYYDTYANYKKGLAGALFISKKAATSLNTFWQELSEKYPNVFSSEVNSNDMPLELIHIIDDLNRPLNTEWYDFGREMMYQDLLQQVYDSYWRAATLYTVSKRYSELENKNAKRINEKIREINELKYKHSVELHLVRRNHEADTKRLIENYRERRKRGVERREQTEMRNKIKRIANDLNKMLLNPTKERYVPEGLKSSVADLMDAINFDTVGAAKRIAEIDERIAKEKDGLTREALEATRERIRAQGENLANKIDAFKSAYTAIKESEDPNVNSVYDEVVAADIAETKRMVEGIVLDTKNAAGDTPLRYMTLEQLEQVYKMLKETLTSIRKVNETFSLQRKAKISDLALRAQEEIKSTGHSVTDLKAIFKKANEFKWSMLKPDTAFRVIGSKALSELVMNFHNAEGKYATNIYGAKQFCQDAMEKYNYDSWDMEKEYGFISHNGKHFNLTLGQMLSLYAYSKRNQAERHLEEGGFVFDSSVTRKKEKDGKETVFKYSVDTGANYTVTQKLLGEIRRQLTSEQIAFVEVMQHYLSSDMANLGNEVSLKMYGIKKYTEEHYFPLKSSSLFIRQLNEPAGEVLLKNSGFSKKLVQYAGNPIVLQDFMEVWTKHVNDMSMYNAFVMPLEDFNRVYNFQERGQEDTEENSNEARKEYATVKQVINSAFGNAANSYIDNLIRELNGGVRTDPSSKFVDKSFSLFKKSAVLGSMSVIVQQPTALPRAFAYIDPKYFKGEKISTAEGEKMWEEMKKYAPVCIIKEMGSFDINMGASTKDYIVGKHYENNVKGKARKVLNKVDDTLSMLPGKADEITWAAIWKAVKRETVTNNPHLGSRSEEFLKKCGERFTEIIVNSQVYDSVLSRSQLMRSKNSLVKMGTAFMAEPTTAVNMLVDAYYKYKRGDKKGAGRITAAVYTAAICAEVMSSIVYALRDDDEDKSYLEKYLTSLSGGIVDGVLIPLSYIPFVKDIYSLSIGYSVERTDMALANDIVAAIKKLSSDNATGYEKGMTLATSIASAFGIPLKNVERDFMAVFNFFKNLGNNIPESGRGMWNAVLDGAKQQVPLHQMFFKSSSKQKKLYDALVSGNEEYIERMALQYSDEKEAVSATRAQIKEEYQEGNISKDVAEMYLKDFCGMSEEDIYWKIKEWDEKPLTGEDESYSKFNNFYAAVESGKNLKAVVNEYLDHGYKKEDLASQITSYFKPIYIDLSIAEKTRLKGYLLNAYVMLGYNRGKKSRDIDAWLKEDEDEDEVKRTSALDEIFGE